MENEKENGYRAGEGQEPDYHTDNRGPVEAEGQPTRNSAAWDSSDGWSSPMDAPSQEDRWSDTGDKPYMGSPWKPTQSGAVYDTGINSGASGNDSQPVYKPAPASYGQNQTGPGQRQQGTNQSQTGGSSQYQTQYQTQYQPYPPVYQEKNNMATASLVMGILSLCSICCCMLFGIVFGVLGIIFAIRSKKGARMDGQAKAGLILSIIGIAVTVLVIIFFAAVRVFTVLPELN